MYRTPGDIDVWCWPQDPCGIENAVSDLDGKGAHGVYTERSRSKKYHGKQAVIEYVRMLHRIAGTEPTEGVRYHHIDAPSVGGIEVEAHFRPLFIDSPLRNWRLQRWFLENEQFGLCDANCGESSRAGSVPALEKTVEKVFPIPTVSFNAVYQLCHIYRHLFDATALDDVDNIG